MFNPKPFSQTLRLVRKTTRCYREVSGDSSLGPTNPFTQSASNVSPTTIANQVWKCNTSMSNSTLDSKLPQQSTSNQHATLWRPYLASWTEIYIAVIARQIPTACLWRLQMPNATAVLTGWLNEETVQKFIVQSARAVWLHTKLKKEQKKILTARRGTGKLVVWVVRATEKIYDRLHPSSMSPLLQIFRNHSV